MNHRYFLEFESARASSIEALEEEWMPTMDRILAEVNH